MGLDDIFDKAKDAVEDIAEKAKGAGIDLGEKAEELLHSEQAEKISDSLLDAGEKAANSVTGGKFAQQVSDVRDGIDGQVGDGGDAK